jgi:NAD(P)-dependent dehydrogenase (short-subunit alcohol dehydrogenase family)
MARKAIFITGGASGIGRAVAQRFGREGWFVGIADINEAGMAETAALLRRVPVRSTSSTCAIALRGMRRWPISRAPPGAVSTWCSTMPASPSAGSSPTWRGRGRAHARHQPKGVIFGAQAAYPWLKRSAPGSCLLNTASAAGIYGTPGASVYTATKFGVRGLTESLDAEWAPDGIEVRDLMPGFIDTPLLDHAPNRASNEDIRGRVKEAGLEITPVSQVADAAWSAIHGQTLHTLVGATARKLAFGALAARPRAQAGQGQPQAAGG